MPMISEARCTSASIDILVVNYNGGRWWPGFCASLAKLEYPADKLRLVVVDNASTDDSVEQLRTLTTRLPFPTEIVETGVNGGFAGGYEVAFRHARADYWFVVNQDTEIAPDALAKLAATLDADPATGIAEARQSPRAHPKYYDPFTGETSWCSGACMLIRPQAMAEAGGGFDTDFFMYAEDVDLSWRMWRHGWKCRYVPDAVVVHFTEDLDPQKKPVLQTYYSLRNGCAMRVSYGTLGEALIHYVTLLRVALVSRGPRWHRWTAFKALCASFKLLPAALAKRWRLRDLPRSPWVFFNGWEYGRNLKDLSLEPAPASEPPSQAPPKQWLAKEQALLVERAAARRAELGRAATTRFVAAGEILVTVVVPTHNRADGLPRVIQRLLEQDGLPGKYEVVIADSASKDHTPQVCKELARDPRVRTVRVERPGAAAARNAGIDLARGRLVVLMDDDILVRRDFLAEFWRAHEARPGNVLLAKIVAPWADLVDPFLRYMLAAQEVNIYNFPDPQNVPADYFFTGCVAVPRQVLGTVRFDENFTVYGVEDIEFGVRLLSRDAKMVFLPNVAVWHEYYPAAGYFIRKRGHSGYSLGYFLEKCPQQSPNYVFEGWVLKRHRWVALGTWLGTPVAKALEAIEHVRRKTGPINRYLRLWYKAAIRVSLYRGLLEYRKPGGRAENLKALPAARPQAAPAALDRMPRAA